MAIDCFSRKASDWNKHHFGNIFGRKKRVLARLNGAQKALAETPSHSLVELEKSLHKELNDILCQEEELWVQKSRINRLIEGDRNTAFHHMSTIVRRRRNRISRIKNDMGEWITSEGGTISFIREGFSKLFSTTLDSSPLDIPQPSRWQAVLSEDDKGSLNLLVSDDEIREGLWALKPFKAPGPDGLHAGFFQRFWPTVKESVRNEIMHIFEEGRIPDYLNRTNIILIPTIAGPESLGNYRPISLCNTVYKIVSKIIVARLRPHLDKLVCPLQSAFVPGRRSVDNAIVVQELIHTISNKKGLGSYMAIKVDLEKAYDKIEWSFIREVLINANLPYNLVNLIMSCVSFVSTSILFNGGIAEPIFPSRGIRQGDPLSPYLFILCMEVLGHIIEDKCSEKSWVPVKSSQSGMAFSHLFFADDLVLFAKADHVNCSTIRDVLDDFCTRSGQSISESKSRVYFSPNVDVDTRESLCDILGFKSTPNLGKYLGFPLKHRGGNNQDQNFILDRVKQNLAGWKANLLSLAGRTVLIQASTSTIPAYVMQCTALPKKLLDDIDRVNRNFLWGSSDSLKRTHWVGWHKVTKAKEQGGLGIQSARGRNQVLLAKLNWRFRTEKDAVWAKVLRSKYCTSRRLHARPKDKLPCSRVWKAIQKGSEVFHKGTRWIPGQNSSLSI